MYTHIQVNAGCRQRTSLRPTLVWRARSCLRAATIRLATRPCAVAWPRRRLDTCAHRMYTYVDMYPMDVCVPAGCDYALGNASQCCRVASPQVVYMQIYVYIYQIHTHIYIHTHGRRCRRRARCGAGRRSRATRSAKPSRRTCRCSTRSCPTGACRSACIRRLPSASACIYL